MDRLKEIIKELPDYAFPVIWTDNERVNVESGMTLLDYFAGQALIPLISGNNLSAEMLAEGAYRIANAMMKARGAKDVEK